MDKDNEYICFDVSSDRCAQFLAATHFLRFDSQ